MKLCASSVGENTLLLNLECGKLKGLGELTLILNLGLEVLTIRGGGGGGGGGGRR